MKKLYTAGVPLFAIILTLVAIGTMAFKGVVNKKGGAETTKVVFADQWYSIVFVDPLQDHELNTNQKITGASSEPTGSSCNRSNPFPNPICGVTIQFAGTVPSFAAINNKTVAQVLALYPGSSAVYTREP